jgi:hypothetical protein
MIEKIDVIISATVGQVMALRITTFSITTLCTIALIIITFTIMTQHNNYNDILNNSTQHNAIQHKNK